MFFSKLSYEAEFVNLIRALISLILPIIYFMFLVIEGRLISIEPKWLDIFKSKFLCKHLRFYFFFAGSNWTTDRELSLAELLILEERSSQIKNER